MSSTSPHHSIGSVAPGAGPVLTATGITKSFDTTEPPTLVLHGVDLAIMPGEFVAIMGASGSGKSTLMHCVSGMDRPTGGSVMFQGNDLTGLDDTEMSNIRLTAMGFVFQRTYFLQNLSIRDNILLPALKASTLPESQVLSHVDALLQRFGIDHVAHHSITRVSGGQLQRAGICRALATHPTIVFADEPTGALNSRLTQEVLDVLTAVHRDGTTMLMVTHDPVCAARADRVIYLRDGLIADEIVQGAWSDAASTERESRVLDWLRPQGF